MIMDVYWIEYIINDIRKKLLFRFYCGVCWLERVALFEYIKISNILLFLILHWILIGFVSWWRDDKISIQMDFHKYEHILDAPFSAYARTCVIFREGILYHMYRLGTALIHSPDYQEKACPLYGGWGNTSK